MSSSSAVSTVFVFSPTWLPSFGAHCFGFLEVSSFQHSHGFFFLSLFFLASSSKSRTVTRGVVSKAIHLTGSASLLTSYSGGPLSCWVFSLILFRLVLVMTFDGKASTLPFPISPAHEEHDKISTFYVACLAYLTYWFKFHRPFWFSFSGINSLHWR